MNGLSPIQYLKKHETKLYGIILKIHKHLFFSVFVSFHNFKASLNLNPFTHNTIETRNYIVNINLMENLII